MRKSKKRQEKLPVVARRTPFPLYGQKFGIIAALVVVVVGFLVLMNFSGDNVAGQATFTDWTAYEAAYWEQAPVDGCINEGCPDDPDETFKAVSTDLFDENGDFDKKFEGFCPPSVVGEVCYYNKGANAEKDGQCYFSNSLTPFKPSSGSTKRDNSLCFENDLYKCQSGNRGVFEDNPKFACLYEGELNRWAPCLDDAYVHPSTLGKFYCDGEETWHECEGTGGIVDDQLCYLSHWEVCEEEEVLSGGTQAGFFCDGVDWHVCDSSTEDPFCVLEFTAWSYEYPGSNLVADILLESGIDDHGNEISDAIDISNNVAYTGIYSVTNVYQKDYSQSFFKYTHEDGQLRNYVISFEDSGDSLTVTVKSFQDTIVEQFTLEFESDSVLSFPPEQRALDLDNDGETEAYLNIIASHPYFGGGALFVVSPVINFPAFMDTDENILTVLTSGNPQQFVIDGEVHTFQLFWEGDDNYVFVVDEQQFAFNDQDNEPELFLDAQGTQKLGFNLFPSGDFFAVMSFTSNVEDISILKLKEKSVDLSEVYEEEFAKNKILELINVEGEADFSNTVAICKEDPPVLEFVTVCSKENEQIDLQHKQVVDLSAPNAFGVNWPVVLWYESPGQTGEKEVSAYHLIDVDPISGLQIKESAQTFATNLVQGRSLALESDGTIYRLSHPTQPFLDLLQLELTDLSNDGTPTYVSEGDQSEVVFNLPLGKQIRIRAVLIPETNEFTYEISSQTLLTETVDLNVALETAVSTYGYVSITDPDLGLITIDPGDNELFGNVMKVQFDGKTELLNFGEEKILPEGELQNAALFYYGSNANAGTPNAFNKYASIHLYTDLTLFDHVHDFTPEDFILPLVKGNRIAFGFEEEVYLLGYSELWDGTSQFFAEKLQLTTLDGENTFIPQQTAEGYTFDMGLSRIDFSISSNINTVDTIEFEGVTSADVEQELILQQTEIIEFVPEDNFSFVLTENNKMLFNGKTYEICDGPITKDIDAQVRVCRDGILINELLLGVPEAFDGTITGLYTQTSPGEKVVIFQHVIDIGGGYQFSNWELLTENLANDRRPLLVWSEKIVELFGGDGISLLPFGLNEYPFGSSHFIGLNETAQGFQSGFVTVGSEIVYFEQELTSDLEEDILLNVEVLEEKIIGDGLALPNDFSQVKFVTEVGGEVYTYWLWGVYSGAIEDENAVILFGIKDGNFEDVFYGSTLQLVPKEVLLPNGVVIVVDFSNWENKMMTIK